MIIQEVNSSYTNESYIHRFVLIDLCHITYSMFLCPIGHKHSQVYLHKYTNQLHHLLVRKLIHLALMNHTIIDSFLAMCCINYSMFLCPIGHKYSQVYLHKYTNQLHHWLVRKLIHLAPMNHTTTDSQTFSGIFAWIY